MDSSFNEQTISVTQIDAARRQLRTAIELWVSDSDPVSIHTLAFAAYQIIHDLNRSNKGPKMFWDAPYVRPEKKQELINIVKSDANFFKHADGRKRSSRPSTIDFNPITNELLFGYSIEGLGYLGEKVSDYEECFMIWKGLHQPDLFMEPWQQHIRDNIPVEAIEGLRKVSKREFFETFFKLRRNLRSD